jgi:glycerate kinase
MKIIIAPDKFKGSLTSMQACEAIREGIHAFDSSIDVAFFPMADGGDGFSEVLKCYIGTVTQAIASVDSLGRKILSSYEWKQDDRIAIIELASCSGLAMLSKEERNPLITSTYGTGIQINDAVKKGAHTIILGLGGSSTNDAGTGILSAMGFEFYDGANRLLSPCGENLLRIKKIVQPIEFPAVSFQIACDVNNPLYGPDGAAFVFSPQKGADHNQVQLLDDGLKQFATIIAEETGKDIAHFPGAGAAGGIAAGLKAFLQVTLVEGIDLVIQASGISNAAHTADVIITGEGKLDRQSLRGKTMDAINALARKNKIPVVALCGKLELDETKWKEFGLALAVEISDACVTEEESMASASVFLKNRTTSIMPIINSLVNSR